MTRTDQHAVVVGASIAGLLAARVLTEHFGRVTLLDRDEMPRQPVGRAGTPHVRHVHGLLSRGRAIIEELFPGTTADLVTRGAVSGDAQANGRYVVDGTLLADGFGDLPSLGVSRPLLEWYVRHRLLTGSGEQVELLSRTSVLDLSFTVDECRVNGVVVADRDGGESRFLPADLVVDASGRTSRTPEWLERRGYAPPTEDVRRVDKQYVTRTFRRTSEPGQPVVRMVTTTPTNPRSGIVLANEEDRWMVGLAGMHGDRPPLEIDEFRAWARTLASPEVADAVDTLQPLDDGVRYRFPANRRRHYERLGRFPEGLVVMGDALCAFDPVYGQGMTVAAVEAEELQRCIADGGTTRLAARFHERAARHIDTPWIIAAQGTDPPGVRRPLADRAFTAYLARLLKAAGHDAVLARAFLRVNHLVDRPQDLLRPPYPARVLRGSLPRLRGGSGPGLDAAVPPPSAVPM